jgi:protein-L-isoaspartate(D-aspartate) O-methyltransferase
MTVDFETARFNMVEQQVRPWNVLNQDVLDLLFAVKREQFVPLAHQAMAFMDMDLPITIDGKATGQTMFSPKVEARFIQAVAMKRHETVVEVGAGSGHMAALLASRSAKVISFEMNPAIAKVAQANLKNANFSNVHIEVADASAEAVRHHFKNVDVIVLSGSVEAIPPWILASLNVGGRLAAIVGQSPVMTAEIHTKITATEYKIEKLYETDTPALSGFPKVTRFSF